MNKNLRPLTPIEEKFLKEAQINYFESAREDDGRPFALGAKNTGNLFSMRVTEDHDEYSGGSVYHVNDSQ